MSSKVELVQGVWQVRNWPRFVSKVMWELQDVTPTPLIVKTYVWTIVPPVMLGQKLNPKPESSGCALHSALPFVKCPLELNPNLSSLPKYLDTGQ